jgi:hypothetical protein
MLTTEQVQYLLGLPKKVKVNGVLRDTIVLEQTVPLQERYMLVAEADESYAFLYSIDQSRKNLFKLTLYLMDNEEHIGLVRIDYSGQHQNPEKITADVPQQFHPYAGKFFGYGEPHIHYYVEGGHKSMSWALPLAESGFEIEKITSNRDIISAFTAFNTLITLKTSFTINCILL